MLERPPERNRRHSAPVTRGKGEVKRNEIGEKRGELVSPLKQYPQRISGKAPIHGSTSGFDQKLHSAFSKGEVRSSGSLPR